MSRYRSRAHGSVGLCALALVCGLLLSGCGESGDGLDLYRKTNNEPGHEFVKAEQFLVPVGSVIVVQGLDFAPGVSTLTPTQQRIVQQVFNSLEEITENTVGDTHRARVADFKRLEFEIRGFPDSLGGPTNDAALSGARAKAVMELLTDLGTPAWRLKAKGMEAELERKSTVVFVRAR